MFFTLIESCHNVEEKGSSTFIKAWPTLVFGLTFITGSLYSARLAGSHGNGNMGCQISKGGIQN